MTKEQIKAINDAMSFLITSNDLYNEYGPGCIETEMEVHKEVMEDEGVPQDICDHFEHIVCLMYNI